MIKSETRLGFKPLGDHYAKIKISSNKQKYRKQKAVISCSL